ncbi:Cyclic di-GMP phosphodiesterase Gmr [Pseudidiomarina piscicola]|uniref:Cyclic di-GMP phosphodiesterase Gmr n=1 Tax=Pseudidiomarina piscicola TaxID=2614830 RepID=A0A6S6WJP9_9GAMM|nr:GGDEF domain-containing phosphodiesterase [Pseudidiomarina piscicola]CAB0150903.1 Cyclic di-GMP phosphodiesterase Gmr [Pseudidiomarina piscicola]VZT40409.1 Cyclic di-GMP phosphodiesterase Gmr [Pseudomonas aeruginosa]
MIIGNYLFRKHTPAQRIILIVVLMAAVAGVVALVWWTGGIKYVYSHAMYIPIALAGIIFGYRGGVIFALIGGFALGPWMPIDTGTMELQEPVNWLYRSFYFVSVGLLAGLSSDTSRRYIQRLKRASRRDFSTKLPNRKALLEHLEYCIRFHPSRNEGRAYFLMVCSIDNAMALRSAFGFEVIDTIIEHYARRLQQVPNYLPQIFRLEPGQIAAVFPATSEGDIEDLMRNSLAALPEHANFKNLSVYVNRHLGGVRLDGSEVNAIALIQNAEIAIARANDRMLDCFVYTTQVSEGISAQLALMADVTKGIERGEFQMHYQPKIELKTGRVFGAEALIRWHHPTRGWVRPDEFIPNAEHSTLILKISEFVLREVIQQIHQWQQQQFQLQIAINISAHDLLQPGFSDLLLNLLNEYNVANEAIELEITEGSLIDDLDQVINELLKLTEANVSVSIDDFGTGYSSLQYLYRLPISLLKVDQVFVKGLPADEDASHIAKAAVVLAQKLGITSLAEGIETQECLDYLGQIGCDYGQGYLFSKPLSADDFVAWYTSYEPIFSAPPREG